MGAIAGAIDLLIDQIERDLPDKASALAYAEIVQKNGERLEIFVKDLLNIARIQDGLIRIDRTDVDVVQIVRLAMERYRPQADAKDLALTISAPPSLRVSIDAEKTLQVISNLLSNAIKFTQQGTISIVVSVTANTATIRVTDTGIGISRSEASRIFDRFYQGRNTHTGSGIGLAIAKAWAEAHGGEIQAVSKGEGKGTTMTFSLPLQERR